MDQSQGNPSLPAGHPFTVQSSAYWSASTVASVTTLAWGVFFLNGLVVNNFKSNDNFHVWCVRGGPGVDPQ